MIETGRYRNDTPALSALDVRDYERIFKVYKASLHDKDFYYYNILKKVEFPVLDGSLLMYHDVLARTAMPILSYQIYGDLKSWWILYLLNKEKFQGAPFFVEGGTQIAYLPPEIRVAIYMDITQATVFANRHF